MNKQRFWQRATDIINSYRSRFTHAILTDEEQDADISSFLTDMDALASEWYNRPDVLAASKAMDESRMEIELAMTTELREFHSGYCLTDKGWDIVKTQLAKMGRKETR